MVYAGSRLYRDDGEYSDPESKIDFRRDSVDEIERKMRAYAERAATDNVGAKRAAEGGPLERPVRAMVPKREG